jgi:hypothetical protein
MAGRGQPRTGGRTKGTPNRLTAAVKDAILVAFETVGGEDYLVRVARSDPRTFCTLLGRLLPSELRASIEGDLPSVVIRDYTGIDWQRLSPELRAELQKAGEDAVRLRSGAQPVIDVGMVPRACLPEQSPRANGDGRNGGTEPERVRIVL